ncbi:MAG: hypothetical protein WB392_06245 [Methanotrichaceae archaeon]
MVFLAHSVAVRATPNPSLGEVFMNIGFKVDEDKLNDSCKYGRTFILIINKATHYHPRKYEDAKKD